MMLPLRGTPHFLPIDFGNMMLLMALGQARTVPNTVKRQSRLSFHVFVAVPMGRAFFRCGLF